MQKNDISARIVDVLIEPLFNNSTTQSCHQDGTGLHRTMQTAFSSHILGPSQDSAPKHRAQLPLDELGTINFILMRSVTKAKRGELPTLIISA